MKNNKNPIENLLIISKPVFILINILIVGSILFTLIYLYNFVKSYGLIIQFLFLGSTLYITIFILVVEAAILAFIARIIFPPLKEGEFTVKSKEFRIYSLHYAVHAIFYCSPLFSFFRFFGFYRLYNRIMGLKGGRYLLSVWSDIMDPYLVEIGENSSLGSYSLLVSHLVTGEKILIKKIKIGKNVTIGLKSTILPGVEIGDNSVIGVGSLVLPNTRIGENEFWAGVPAQKIKNL